MTAIGDPSAPSGRSGSVFWPHRRGTIRRSGRRLAHTRGSAQPPRHALELHQARTYCGHRPPARKKDRKKTGSFTLPTPADIKSAHRADRESLTVRPSVEMPVCGSARIVGRAGVTTVASGPIVNPAIDPVY